MLSGKLVRCTLVVGMVVAHVAYSLRRSSLIHARSFSGRSSGRLSQLLSFVSTPLAKLDGLIDLFILLNCDLLLVHFDHLVLDLANAMFLRNVVLADIVNSLIKLSLLGVAKLDKTRM